MISVIDHDWDWWRICLGGNKLRYFIQVLWSGARETEIGDLTTVLVNIPSEVNDTFVQCAGNACLWSSWVIELRGLYCTSLCDNPEAVRRYLCGIRILRMGSWIQVLAVSVLSVVDG